ncbi:unnamed protein product, partial [marine sediment metagenome]
MNQNELVDEVIGIFRKHELTIPECLSTLTVTEHVILQNFIDPQRFFEMLKKNKE